MIAKIAWRNVWRNKLRSLTVMLMIALGIWAGLFASALMQGITKERSEMIIHSQLSHLQIHAVGYLSNNEVQLVIEQPPIVQEIIRKDERVEAVSSRVISMAMAQTAHGSAGLRVRGINPTDEAAVVGIDDSIIEGSFLEGKSKNGIVVSADLATKLKLSLRKKVKLTMSTVSGDFIEASFKVVGIYKTHDRNHDLMTAFVSMDRLSGYLSDRPIVHEIAVLLKGDDTVDAAASDFKTSLGSIADYDVRSWKELLPGLDIMNRMASVMNGLLLLLLISALLFGVINTMMMAVVERVREFGVLMAVGMNKSRLFLMVVAETVFLMFLGAPLGLFIAFSSISYLEKYGMDLSAYSDGFNAAGLSPIIHPSLDPNFYWIMLLLIFFASLVASLYPAWRATQQDPAAAIRKI